MRYELTETIEELLGVTIAERGENASVLCPFHDERTPSFSIHLDTGQWQCFGCGMMGGIEKLGRLLGDGLDEETRQNILIRSTFTQPKTRSNLAPLANQYREGARRGRGRARVAAYLEERRLPEFVAEHFGLGYDESRDCIALPYWDGATGTVSGIKLRGPDGSKYSVSDSTYGLYNVDDARGKPTVVIGEGESDTHQLWARLVQPSAVGALDNDDVRREGHQVGVVGTSGALKSERLWQLFTLDLLFARKVFICYDADDAGDTAFKVAQRYLKDKAIRIRPPIEGDDVTKFLIEHGGTLEDLGLASEALLI